MKLFKLQYALECGMCPVKVHDFIDGKLKKTPEYNEIQVELDDGSLMKIAMCNKHKDLNDDSLPQAMEKVKKGWIEELSLGTGNAEWVREVGLNLNAVRVM